MNQLPHNNSDWSVYRLFLFRFFAIYFILSTAVWSWLSGFPWLSFLGTFDSWFAEGYTNLFNDYIYQIKEELVPTWGSGDTSMGWATLYAQLFIASIGSIIWSVLDRKRKKYTLASLAIRNVVRYYVILFAFIYGIIKIFGLQMPAPSNSYYATDLGHFSAMRFTWNFVGYSAAYQFFSGFSEVLVGLLLLNRRTVVMGSLFGVGVFSYVFLLNMTFDIPVKIFSFQLLFACLFLSLGSMKRVLSFFVLNKPTAPDTSWEIPMIRPWFKYVRIGLKLAFIGCFVAYPFYNYYNSYVSRNNQEAAPPFESGYYAITNFVLNGDTIPPHINSKLHWHDLAIDNGNRGSIGLIDSTFRVRYGRSYFYNYTLDSLTDELTIKQYANDSIPIFKGSYQTLANQGLKLTGIYKTQDSLQVDLQWDERNYQLAKKEFNWMLESVP